MAVTDFSTKAAVVVRDDLAPWQRLNVTAFLVSGSPPRISTWWGSDCARSTVMPMPSCGGSRGTRDRRV